MRKYKSLYDFILEANENVSSDMNRWKSMVATKDYQSADALGKQIWAKANPKLALANTERQRIRGTSETDNPMMKDLKGNLSSASSSQSPNVSSLGKGFQSLMQKPNTTTVSPKPVPAPVSPKPVTLTLTSQQLSLYNQAYQNRNNSMARGIIRNRFNQLTPDQKQQFRNYAQQQGHDWGDLIQ